MTDTASILLTGFADEAANEKTIDQQFAALAALGLRYLSIRFIDAGQGIKNVMGLTDGEIDFVISKLAEYGLSISSLGSPIGKVRLCDVEDGTTTPYRPFDEYLETEVVRACDLANRFETKLVRGFSFYHPVGSDLSEHFPQAVDQVGKIADRCRTEGLVFGLEVEANLIGQSGQSLAKMHKAIGNDSLVTIFDGGNLAMQGYSTAEIFEEYVAMKPSLGWLHIKDYAAPQPVGRVDHVDEESIKHFVPADVGDSGHLAIMKDFAEYLPTVDARMKALGVPGVFVDMEPHVKGGGQFGGFSGPDGFGVALRAFCRVCDEAGVDYRLRDFSDIQQDRGF